MQIYHKFLFTYRTKAENPLPANHECAWLRADEKALLVHRLPANTKLYRSQKNISFEGKNRLNKQT